jgi:hypothetical protein
MTQAAHTPGPLTISKGEMTIFLVLNGTNIGAVGGANPIGTANAARIAACWNACEGLADPSVLPELVRALEWAIRELNGQNRYDEDVAGEQEENCYRMARAALAKVKGGAA